MVLFINANLALIIATFLWPWVKKFDYQKGDWKFLLSMSLAEPCLYFYLRAMQCNIHRLLKREF